jgi:hypothetical protein
MPPLIPLPALVIPDVHDRTILVERLIERYASDGRSVVFLGDYFNSDWGGPLEAHFTARWLEESLSRPNRYHLIGNHDASYFYFGHSQTRCSAWSEEKHRAITGVLGDLREVASRMYLALRVGPWLLSHAGFSGRQFRGAPTDALLYWAGVAQHALATFRDHPLLAIGPSRGGVDRRGGVLWCDFKHEFTNVGGVNQITGHGGGASMVRCRQLRENNRYCYAEVCAGEFNTWPYHVVGSPCATAWCIDAELKACATIASDRLILHIDGEDMAFAAPSELDEETCFPLVDQLALDVKWASVPPAYVAWETVASDIIDPEWRFFLEGFCKRKSLCELGPSVADVEYSLRKLKRMGWNGSVHNY